MSMIQAVWDYFANCPLLENSRILGVDRLGVDPIAFDSSIETNDLKKDLAVMEEAIADASDASEKKAKNQPENRNRFEGVGTSERIFQSAFLTVLLQKSGRYCRTRRHFPKNIGYANQHSEKRTFF